MARAAIFFAAVAALQVATTGAAVAVARVGKIVTHSPPRSRVMEAMGGNGSSIPANGAVWPTAIFWSTVQVGTPPVDFPVAIDSGSGDLDIAGAGCAGCVTTAPNKAYDAASSSTSKAAFPYRFSNTYQTCDLKDPTAPCSISGKLFADQVSLAGLGPVAVTLGSIEKQDSNFDQFAEIDGVMGFTSGGDKNVFAQLVAGGHCENVWALCLNEGSTSNGTLTVGGVEPTLASEEIAYVPDVGAGFHSVKVESLVLGGEVLAGTGGSAILDTGTNVLLVPSKAMKALQSSMCADPSIATSCTALWTSAAQCADLTEAQVDAFPPLALRLDGLDLNMTSRDYLLRGSPLAASAGQFCLGIRDGGSAGGSGFIIGDTTMRSFYLVFDLAQKRIGWGKVNRDTCGSL